MPTAPISLVLLLLSAATGPVCAVGGGVFADGFESGDTAAWSGTVGGPASGCASGGGLGGVLEGDLGPAPAGGFTELACLEVTNDSGFERFEIAYSGAALPAAAGLSGVAELAVIGAGERRLAAQFHVLSRWGAPLADTSAPIRWLEVTLPARVAANTTARYSLRRYPGLAAAVDPFALTVVDGGATVTVDTGLATFVLDPADPRLFESIAIDLDDDGVGRVVVANGPPGTGPRMAFDPGGGEVVLDTTIAGRVVVDPGGFLIARAGPDRAVVRMNGHFVAPALASRCTRDGLDYERFGFTVEASFTRASRDIGLDFHLRNECSDGASSGDGNQNTDDAVAIRSASFELPFALGATTHYHAASAGVVASAPGFAGVTRVEQARGGGVPWARIARVRRDGTPIDTAQAFAEPLVAVADASVLIAATMPWMRMREPQAIAISGATVSLATVGEDLIVGEGKGIWGAGVVRLEPRAGIGDVATYLAGLRPALVRRVERGLLVHPARATIDTARLFAPLGNAAPSALRGDYLATMTAIHDQTVGLAGQWARAKTYGSQLWPETQFDEFGIDNDDPFSNFVPLNYWQPVNAEIMEYLRSGDPRWAWDFALPQMWLQLYSAYLNLGDRTHSNRNGLAINSGGGGEGHWHRSNFGSDDYTYDLGFDVAYVVRPSQALLDRISRTGQTLVDRYDVPWVDQDQRDVFINAVDVTRGNVQHFLLLANCAEFAPGAQGQSCHDRLQEILTELVADNLSAGLFCEGDIPSATTCGTPQQFMINALFYHFFHRMRLAYGDIGGLLQRALVEQAAIAYQYGFDRLGDGVSIDPNGVFAAALSCTLQNGGSEVATCVRTLDGEGNDSVYEPVRPSSLFLLLLAHDLDPSVGLCTVARNALDALDPIARWDDWFATGSGWWKGSAQMMQGATVGVGVYESCGP